MPNFKLEPSSNTNHVYAEDIVYLDDTHKQFAIDTARKMLENDSTFSDVSIYEYKHIKTVVRVKTKKVKAWL